MNRAEWRRRVVEHEARQLRIYGLDLDGAAGSVDLWALAARWRRDALRDARVYGRQWWTTEAVRWAVGRALDVMRGASRET